MKIVFYGRPRRTTPSGSNWPSKMSRGHIFVDLNSPLYFDEFFQHCIWVDLSLIFLLKLQPIITWFFAENSAYLSLIFLLKIQLTSTQFFISNFSYFLLNFIAENSANLHSNSHMKIQLISTQFFSWHFSYFLFIQFYS